MDKFACIDIDGCLADFEGDFCERFGYENRTFHSLHSRYPQISADLITEFVESPETYQDLIPIFGGLHLASQLARAGYKIILMTSRPQSTRKLTEQWMSRYWVNYEELIYTKDKPMAITIFNTANMGKAHIDLIVDDYPRNLMGMPMDVTPYIWEQPWNSHGELIPLGSYLRYNSEQMQLEVSDTRVNWTKWSAK